MRPTIRRFMAKTVLFYGVHSNHLQIWNKFLTDLGAYRYFA